MIGAGNRGADAYGKFAKKYPEKIHWVAVCDSNPDRLHKFADTFNIDPENRYTDYIELLSKPKLASAAVIALPDHLHHQAFLMAAEKGYHILLEKPMALNARDCLAIEQRARDSGVYVELCHVLRHTPFFQKLHEILTDPETGDIISVSHNENVSFWHMAHSYVRGNWSQQSVSPIILAKTCHDFDILLWNLLPRMQSEATKQNERKIVSVYSTGSLVEFRSEKAPAEIKELLKNSKTVKPGDKTELLNCKSCPIEESCIYSAKSIYERKEPYRDIIKNVIGENPDKYQGWPVSVMKSQPEQYYRCIFDLDNDVVDHQTVQILFTDGTTVNLQLNGHAAKEGRTMRYNTSRSTVHGIFSYEKSEILVEYHNGRTKSFTFEPFFTGHGGGDEGIMHDFFASMQKKNTNRNFFADSHLLAFAAEKSRIEQRIINFEDFKKQYALSFA